MNLIKNMKVGAKLVAAFVLVSIIGAVVGLIGIGNMSKINDMADEMYQKELLGVSYISEANINLVYVGRDWRAAMIAVTHEDRLKRIEDVKKKLGEMKGNLEQARPLFYSEKGKELMKKMDEEIKEWEGTLQRILTIIPNENMAKLSSEFDTVRNELRVRAAKVDETMGALSKLKEDNAAKASKATTELYQTSRALMLAFIFGALALGIMLGILISRSITRPLGEAVKTANAVAAGDLTSKIEVGSRDETGQLLEALKTMNENLVKLVGSVRMSVDTIATGTGQIATGNSDLSQRTEEQASSLEETASSMEELTSTVKQNAENAKQANQLAKGASDVAMKGGDVVGKVVTTMASINESSKKIVDIISVIEGIAFQTNILALNAAVEAARAGEQGRGFAVVASEVRSLAQRSAAAAKEIKTLIGDSVREVEGGTVLVDQAGKTMEEVVSAVKRMTDIMAEITAASAEQSSGIEQVNQAVMQMDNVTQQNAALVEEAAAAAESLEEEAQNLAQAVSVFRLDSSAGGSHPVARHEMPKPAAAAPRAAAPAAPAAKQAPPPARKAAGKAKALSAAREEDEEWKEF